MRPYTAVVLFRSGMSSHVEARVDLEATDIIAASLTLARILCNVSFIFVRWICG